MQECLSRVMEFAKSDNPSLFSEDITMSAIISVHNNCLSSKAVKTLEKILTDSKSLYVLPDVDATEETKWPECCQTLATALSAKTDYVFNAMFVDGPWRENPVLPKSTTPLTVLALTAPIKIIVSATDTKTIELSAGSLAMIELFNGASYETEASGQDYGKVLTFARFPVKKIGRLDIGKIMQDVAKNPNEYAEMLGKFSAQLTNDIKNATTRDTFLKAIKKSLSTVKVDPNVLEYRIKARVSDIRKLLGSVQVKKYLDVGCNDGKLTSGIAKALKIDPKNVYGVDVPSWDAKPLVPVIQNFKQIDPANCLIPIRQDDSFDLITCHQVLHHSMCQETTIKEMKRLLKPGGFLVLREHDLRRGRYVFDFEHIVHMLQDSEPAAALDEFYAVYRPYEEWDKLIGLPVYGYTDIKGPARYYTCVYRKPL
jgi:SAM-dependent methyltransferase